jgi:hypothetical protein
VDFAEDRVQMLRLTTVVLVRPKGWPSWAVTKLVGRWAAVVVVRH